MPRHQTVRIPLGEAAYEVLIGDDLLGASGQIVREACPGRRSCALVYDSHVGPLYGPVVSGSLEEAGFEVTNIGFPAGEGSKSMGMVGEICDRMILGRLDRGACLVALGGGVTGDLAGFAAAVFCRGIPYVQIPTTLLAQVDSSVGGKTGVNAPAGKNLIGSFHQPRAVIADVSTLATLPAREYNEGFAEIIKHGVIRDADLLAEVRSLADSMDDGRRLARLVARNVAIKAAIVAEDAFETSGLRALLNFGHTVGHAVEQAGGYGRFLHGEAIAIGIAAALALSRARAGLSAGEEQAVLSALRAFSLPVWLPADIPQSAILEALQRDKKFAGGHVRFVLTPRLGEAYLSDEISGEDLRIAIEGIRQSGPE